MWDQRYGKGEGLVIGHGVETVRTVVESRLRNGDGAVVQVLARRPA